MKKYTIGIDFGSLSGRAVLMDADNGNIVATSISEYKSGVISSTLPSGKRLPSGTALQDADDYLDVLKTTIREVLTESGVKNEQVVGVGVDFTACTMLPVDENMIPLMFRDEYKDELHAYVKLWKHGTALKERDDIDSLAQKRGEEWHKIYGNKTSPEWMFARILQILREAPNVYDATFKFVNSADWITYLLTGQITYSAPFAGYKALWNEKDGFPSRDFFKGLDPRMENIIGTKICDNMKHIGEIAGYVTKDGAALTGLREGTPVATPLLDAHASVPALGVTEEGTLVLILGTSAVHMVHSQNREDISGICGYAKDGIIEGMYTYEASQACCGDHLNWFVKNCVPAEYMNEAQKMGINIHKYLRQKAEKLKVGESGLIALDWHNGNRSVLSDLSLTGAIFGLTLETKPEEMYRAYIEAAVFGARVIIENFENNGIKINKVVASGGIAEKDELFMKICADIFNRPITVPNIKQSAAKGSAICGAVAARSYPSIKEAANALGIRDGKEYLPNKENANEYDKLYAEYLELHDHFGRGGSNVLKNRRI